MVINNHNRHIEYGVLLMRSTKYFILFMLYSDVKSLLCSFGPYISFSNTQYVYDRFLVTKNIGLLEIVKRRFIFKLNQYYIPDLLILIVYNSHIVFCII